MKFIYKFSKTSLIKVLQQKSNNQPFKKIITVLFFIVYSVTLYSQVHNWNRTNPGGGGAFSTIEAGPPSVTTGAMQIIAGSDLSGAYYSWDNGQSWEVYGANNGLLNTHVSGLGFHPTNSNIFFLGVDGGIYKSQTGVDLYQVLNNGYITDIEVSPVNNQIVYASYHSFYNTNDGSIYKSTDGGETFIQISNTSLVNGLHLLEVVAHPINQNIVYALAGEGRFSAGPASAYRSIDGGINWTQLTPTTDNIMHLAISGNTLYISSMLPVVQGGSCSQGNNGNLYKSNDSGDSWETNPIANLSGVIFIDFTQPNTIRLIDPRCPYSWFSDSGTWTSTDGGINWVNTGLPENWTTGYNDVNSPQWSYGTSYNGISKTLGGSKTDPNAIFWTNVQWAFGSFDGGTTFNHLHTKFIDNGWQSTGIDNIVMLDISSNSSNPDEIYIGFADIGLWRSVNGGQSWIPSNPEVFTGNWQGFGGNCHSILTDPDVPGKVWVSLQGDYNEEVSLLYSTQQGEVTSWVKLGIGIPTSTTKLYGLSLDKNSNINNRTLFATAEGDVYRSQDNGQNWTNVLLNGNLHLTSVDKQNGQIVYAGGADGLYLSTNGGNTWLQVISPPSEANNSNNDPYDEEYIGISSLDPDPNTSESLYYTYYGGVSTIGGVYRWNENVATLLYESPYMRSVKINPANSNQIYAGSSYAYYRGFYDTNSEGVLYSENGGENWLEVNGETSWHFAVCLEITESSNPKIFAGITGSGFQFADVPSVLEVEEFNIVPVVNIYPNPAINQVTIDANFNNYGVTIFDISGRIITNYESANKKSTFQTTPFSSGFYFIVIQPKGSKLKIVSKIIKI